MKRNLFVTALGEVLENGACIPELCSVNLRDLLGPEFYKLPDDVLSRKTDAEFERRYRKLLTPAEHGFVSWVLKYQKHAPAGRFRVYGELSTNGRRRIWLVTEFREAVENRGQWERIEAARKQSGAVEDTLTEYENTEHWQTTDADGKTTEHFEPNYGKVERQVEFSWRIEGMSVPTLKRLISRVSKQTQEIWQHNGVSVS